TFVAMVRREQLAREAAVARPRLRADAALGQGEHEPLGRLGHPSGVAFDDDAVANALGRREKLNGLRPLPPERRAVALVVVRVVWRQDVQGEHGGAWDRERIEAVDDPGGAVVPPMAEQCAEVHATLLPVGVPGLREYPCP